jgi:hypothetical protein
MVNPLNPIVSETRVKECEVSARFWASEIGSYAQHMRELADRYAIVSALLSTLTGLGVWSILAASNRWPAVLAVSLVALAAAAVALIPKNKGFGACAEAAASLEPRYGHILGDLKDALELLKRDPAAGQALALQAVTDFEQVKAAKATLKPYPTALQEKINKIRASETN